MKATKENNTNFKFLTPLYRHIFYGRFSSVVVLLLLTSMVLQPIDRAHASDTDSSTLSPAPIDTTTAIATTDVPVVSQPVTTEESPATITETASESVTSTTSPTDLPLAVPESITSSQDTIVSSSTDILITASSSTETTTVSDVENQPDAPPETNGQGAASEPDLTATTTANPTVDDLQKASTTTEFSSTTASTTGSTFNVTTIPTADSDIQFNKNDCVAVANGSYYCHTKQIATTSEVADGLYSQPDIDGDLEIYFAKNGVLEQITHNTVDDASPFYDSISNTIVWHRMIDDRYQIISYDIKSGAESQLTTDSVNNMEPNRAGKYTVWQHWNKDNWDIMLYDGSAIKLLTDTPQHDIAPVIRGNLVMWNRLTSDKKQTIELYDLTSGEYTTIHDSEGGALSNPRMVLVYDAEFENGDVVTKGYDVATGKITPLSSIPASLPSSIPPPDKTGETRALIQGKSAGREDSELMIAPKPTIDPPLPGVGTSTATSSDASTINMQQGFASSTTAVATSTDFTLDLSTTTSLQIVPSDVVVPTFSQATTTE